MNAAANVANATRAAAGNIVNSGSRLIASGVRETGGFFQDAFYLLRNDPSALGGALGQGLRDGQLIVANEMTFGQIPALRDDAEALVRDNGGLYVTSQFAGAAGRELFIAAATAGAGGAVMTRVASTAQRFAPNLVCRLTTAQRVMSPVTTIQNLRETSRQIDQVRSAMQRGDVQAAARAFARGTQSSFFLGQNLAESRRMMQAVTSGDTQRMADYFRACFAAGTPILGEFGSKPIEEYRVGDLVWARAEHDPACPVELKPIEELFVRQSTV